MTLFNAKILLGFVIAIIVWIGKTQSAMKIFQFPIADILDLVFIGQGRWP